MLIVAFLIILGLIAVTALYVAAEFAAVSVRRSRVQQLAQEGNRPAERLLPILKDGVRLDRYIAVSQIGITLSSLILGAYGQAKLAGLLIPLFEGLGGMQRATAESASAVMVLLLLTILHMILGELVPKSLALQYPTQTALATFLPMRWSQAVLNWAITFLNGSGILILKLLGIPQTGHRHIHSPEEIELLIAESSDGGLLEPEEQRRLHRALRLELRPVSHLMVPRMRVMAINVDMPIHQVLEVVNTGMYTRLPVYRNSIDDIVGVVNTKNLVVEYLRRGSELTIAEVMQPALIIPENATASQLLTEFRRQRRHQAIVMDEFGGVAGLVTLEDLLEEVFGGVSDDAGSMDLRPEKLGDGSIRLPGSMRLDEAQVWTGVQWQGKSATVNGRIMEALGHLPARGEKGVVDGMEVTVEEVEHHAIVSVLVRPLESGGEEEE